MRSIISRKICIFIIRLILVPTRPLFPTKHSNWLKWKICVGAILPRKNMQCRCFSKSRKWLCKTLFSRSFRQPPRLKTSWNYAMINIMIALGGGNAEMGFFSRSQEKVSTGKGGSVLTCRELRDLGIIQEGDKTSYQLTSYDLRLGSCHYVFDNSQKQDDDLNRARWRLFHIGSDTELQILNRDERGSQKYEIPRSSRHTLTIPPYGSAIIELKETVDTYTAAVKYHALVVGRFDLKLSKVYQALISQQATQVEPFYEGKLYCFIHNLSGNAIYMDENDKIATIEFSYAGEHLNQNQREKLIQDSKNNETEKYIKSQYASEHKRGIGEVRWFYEQKRLHSDCGLNGLYAKAERDVASAVNRFDLKFEDYFAREDTLKDIAERVHDRIREKQRSLEILVSVVTGVISLGVGSMIWMFYQELVKIMARQEMFNTYLSGNPIAKEISQTETVFEQYPWLVPCIILIALIVFTVVIGVAFFAYAARRTKKIDQLAQEAIERELLKLKDKLPDSINEEYRRLQRRQDELDTKYACMAEKLCDMDKPKVPEPEEKDK